ncbi:MutS protein msh4 [Nowakowskiella sp. JEL0407]|nr:MutS protein msh4 [Nowakowskiella sp. JEL0407]
MSRNRNQSTQDASSVASSNDTVVAMSESRGSASGEVGLAAINCSSGQVLLCQFADSSTYVRTLHALYRIQPNEILLPNTNITPTKSTLCELVEEKIGKVSPVLRKYFNVESGMQMVNQFSLKEDISTLLVAVKNKYYCLSALSALLKYVETSLNMLFCNHSLRIRFETDDGIMLIDYVTAKNLELIANLNDSKSNHSLYGIINHTQTAMGSRLLRTNILQPISEANTLEMRLDAVNELTRSETLFYNAQNAIKEMVDIDKVTSALMLTHKSSTVKSCETAINKIISLKHVLKLVLGLQDILADVENELLKAMCELFSSKGLKNIENCIDEVINEDVTYQKNAVGLQNQRCYAVKAGFNGLLDVARQTYKETISDIYELINQYTEKYGLPMKSSYTPSLGFFMTTKSTTASGEKITMLPPEFINPVYKKNHIQCTTLRLVGLNDRIKESLTEIYLMSDRTISSLIDKIRENVACLYKAAESVALLDMLISFAHYATITDSVRPEFTDTLAIQHGRHPIREKIFQDTKYVPNDVYAGIDSSFQIITGPNLSGKSTYLRQIALITVMAQIGSYVPADFASASASTFMIEMRETAFILQNVGDQSIVIIDELGRGTSTADGVGISYVICEKLLKTRAFVFFATHFHQLVPALSSFPNVVSLHLRVEIEANENKNGKMKFLYTIQSGCSSDENYGIRLAKIAGLPEKMIEKSLYVSQTVRKLFFYLQHFFTNTLTKTSQFTRKLEESREKNKKSTHDWNRKLNLMLVQRLLEVRQNSTLSPAALAEYLRTLRTEFANKLDIGNQSSSSDPPSSPSESTEHHIIEE